MASTRSQDSEDAAVSRLSSGSVTDELKRRLESYRVLLDSAPAVVWRANAQTAQFTFVSAYAEILLGYPLEAWLNEQRFWQDHIHPEDREWVIAACSKATQEKRTHDLDYRMLAADGRVIWVRDICCVVGVNDQPTELIGILVDVTETKRAQKALQRSEEYLRQVIDTIPQEIWSGPADGTLDFCNARWLANMGLSLEQIQGDGWHQILHPDDRERVLRAWNESVRTGKLYENQERHRIATGEYRWRLCRGVPLRDEHGKIVRWFGTNTDIDDQKKAEDALRASEQRWRGIFNNSNVGVGLQDASLRYIDANEAFCRMVGYTCDELRQLTCLDITHEDDREKYKTFIDELLSGKRSHFNFEKRYRTKNGGLIWARLNGSIVNTADRPIWVVIEEDITDEKKLRDKVQQERDRLGLLLDLNKKFAPKLDLQELFQALSVSLREIEGWEYSLIALPESAKDLRIHLIGPGRSELWAGLNVPIEGTFAGKAYRSGQAEFFLVADLLPVPGYPELSRWREFTRADGLQTGCNVPLRYDGEVLGVLGLHTRRDLNSIKADLAFLQELAKLVAIALHNALRYGELSTLHERLSYQKEYIEAEFLRDRGISGIVGGSPAIASVIRQIDAVAPTDSTVLITGETGTGKELVARAIHDRSPRHDHSFIKVDCAAIPASLMESELFGHEKGAFTGATAQRLGRFEIADHGTIFLDEIGDVPLELQPKLLRVLQDRSFERVGSNVARKVDVRVIAATNRDLQAMVQEGKFRDDLYYRLKVFPILIPPLRERSSDIPLLVRHFVGEYAKRMKKHVTSVPPDAMSVFTCYPWPGNIRELQHFIERSVIITSGSALQPPLGELERAIKKGHARQAPAQADQSLEEIEREAILKALEQSRWVVGGPQGAAAKLGLKRTTLASRMERLGIARRK